MGPHGHRKVLLEQLLLGFPTADALARFVASQCPREVQQALPAQADLVVLAGAVAGALDSHYGDVADADLARVFRVLRQTLHRQWDDATTVARSFGVALPEEVPRGDDRNEHLYLLCDRVEQWVAVDGAVERELPIGLQAQLIVVPGDHTQAHGEFGRRLQRWLRIDAGTVQVRVVHWIANPPLSAEDCLSAIWSALGNQPEHYSQAALVECLDLETTGRTLLLWHPTVTCSDGDHEVLVELYGERLPTLLAAVQRARAERGASPDVPVKVVQPVEWRPATGVSAWMQRLFTKEGALPKVAQRLVDDLGAAVPAALPLLPLPPLPLIDAHHLDDFVAMTGLGLDPTALKQRVITGAPSSMKRLRALRAALQELRTP